MEKEKKLGRYDTTEGANPFLSILDPEMSSYRERERPAFFLDLNLNQVIDRICREWGGEVASFYYYFPANAACEEYRREIFSDVKQEGCSELLCDFLKKMQARQEALAKKEAVRIKMQRAAWHFQEVLCYCEAFQQLSGALEEIPLRSEGMLAFRAYLRQYLAGEFFLRMQEGAAGLQEEMQAFRLVLTYENDRITVELGEVEGEYERFLGSSFPNRQGELKSLFGAALDLTELEQKILHLLQKRKPEFFQRAEAFYREFGEYTEEVLMRFASEIRYYLAFCRFERKMEERGFSFVRPVVGEMSVRGLYDLALACQCGEERQIVRNDAFFGEEERFFVLTGPNQGGKTTFARSLGQLVYFAKMGLEVPAESASLPCFTELLTHFSVEESVETGRGKLKEELVRLVPMMEAVGVSPASQSRALTGGGFGAFVIINELFTTAAHYDACIMGKRVLEHFLAQRCRGIYVTHLKELAEPCQGIVSLRAMLDEQGRQTFRIVRGEAADTASAVNQVRKHRLTYEALKERLSRPEPGKEQGKLPGAKAEENNGD